MGFDYVVAAELAPEAGERSSVSAAGGSKESGARTNSDKAVESKGAVGGDAESKADASGPAGVAEAAVR